MSDDRHAAGQQQRAAHALHRATGDQRRERSGRCAPDRARGDSEQRPVSAAAAAGVPIGEAVGAIGDTIEALPADTYPNLVATARELTGPGIDARFEFVLERFLDGPAMLPRTTRADPDPTDPTGSPEPTNRLDRLDRQDLTTSHEDRTVGSRAHSVMIRR
ncbi:hypothetical protein ACIRL2_08565 [Embleya sp. NPDC127516]|uniref:hypothetical protein n=1 Tax=Embleya sp. NPDC127516 TaxID=3363990 RepID=UPI0037FD45B5